MLVLVIRTMASFGSLITGSGTCSTRTLRWPCQVTAFINASSVLESLALPRRRPAKHSTGPRRRSCTG